MTNFYEHLSKEQADQIDALTKLAYELREHRRALLARHGVADEFELLDRIAAGTVDEHPAYEHYLSARMLAEAQAAIRADLKDYLLEGL